MSNKLVKIDKLNVDDMQQSNGNLSGVTANSLLLQTTLYVTMEINNAR